MLQISCSVRCRFFDVLRDQRDTDTEAPSPSMARVVVPVVPALLPGGPPASKIARNAGKGYMLSYLGMYIATDIAPASTERRRHSYV